MDDKNEVKYIKLQAPIDEELHNRFKKLAALRGVKIPDLVADLVEDFIEREEDKYLDEVLAKRLQAAHDGKPLRDIANLDAYHQKLKEEVLAKEKE